MAYQPVSVWFDAFVPIVVLAVTVGVTIWLAYRQVKKQRRLAADRATLKFIAGHEIHNPDWRRLETVFAEQMSAGRDSDTSTPWKRLLGLDTQSARQDALDVRSFLNHYELVAIAIREGIINESLYAMWYRTSYVRIWQKAEPYIVALRQERKSDQIYCNLEEQAHRWAKP